MCVGGRAPSLRHAQRLEARVCRTMLAEELCRQLERQLLAVPPLLRGLPERTDDVGGVGDETEDYVVDRDAVVEFALLIEVDHLLDRVRRRLLAHIVEGPAIAERRERRAIAFVEAEEATNPETAETVTLCKRVLASRPDDESLRKQDPVYGAGEISSWAYRSSR